MARWADIPNAHERRTLDALYRDLLRARPRGWSVTRGLREVLVRPEARGAGRFGVTIAGGRVRGAFHDRRAGVWTAEQTWPAGEAHADTVLAWAQAVVVRAEAAGASGDSAADARPAVVTGEAERAALRLLAEDEFCTPFELVTVVELWGGRAADAEALLEAWRARGWVELLPQGEPDTPTLVRLTEAGYAEHASRAGAS